MNGLVSIIMPSYNTAAYISESIRSVIAQTYSDWELLIVDDCSTDNTDAVIAPFLRDSRVHYLKNEKNSGAAISRNRALREAKGKWIAFLDSDDLWHPEKLTRQISYMKDNNYSFCCTDYRVQRDGKWESWYWTGPSIVDRRRLYDYCFFSTITVIYDREKIGLIQIPSIRKNNDYALWLQIIEKSPCYRLKECLSYYIQHKGSVSSGSKLKLFKWHYRLWHDVMGKSNLCAIVFTARNIFWGAYKKVFCRRRIDKCT